VIICVIEPRNAISCSFLLSFCATLGITFCGLYAEKAAAVRLRASRVGDMRLLYKAVRAVLASLIVTVCAVLFTAPVMAAVFGELSFFAVVMNAFAVPMAFVSMLLTLSVLFFGNIPIAGEMLCDLYNGLFSGFEALTDSVSSSFETSVSLLYPFFMPCLALCASLLVFLNIVGVNSDDDLGVFLKLDKHPDLTVGSKARKNSGCVEIVKELTAEFKIELTAEEGYSLLDLVRLKL
jgi:hypothetical protein